MKPSENFVQLPPEFWAHVRLASEDLGYSSRNTKALRRYGSEEIERCLGARHLDTRHLAKPIRGTPLKELLAQYLNHRARVLEHTVEPNLMTREQAQADFERLRKTLQPKCHLPLNKQKGEKRHFAYLSGIVNMLTEASLRNVSFDDNPGQLTVVTRNGKPLRTLSRRMDGVYPFTTNPIALWEVKEYYGTTTFGSRVADGIYESMLDGMELAELQEHEGIHIRHYLIVDDHFTWWTKGKSYLCRIVDMLHMGLIDEALFGREVLKRWPSIVKGWPK